MDSDIRIKYIDIFKVNTHARTPLKFGAVIVDELPIAYAKVMVENKRGKIATGWGAMFLMDLWAWPISKATHSVKNKVMGELISAYAKLLNDYKEFAHPIVIFMETKKDLERLNAEICKKLTPGEVMPYLGVLICASPIDHAIHDAFGNVNGIDSYLGYDSEYMSFDLSRYLGSRFRDIYPSQFLRQRYLPEIPIFHLIGGLDLLHKEEVPEDFRCPNCGCKYFQTLEEKIQEERDLDEFRERVRKGNISWTEAKKIAELEAIRHIPH